MPFPRRATPDDLPAIVALAETFGEMWQGLGAFDPDSFAETVRNILDAGVIFLSERGFIGLIVVPWSYNRKVRIAAEAFFWAPDGRGDDLRRAAELWAGERAELICMSSHIPGPVDRIDRWYRRKGYLEMGHQFAKAVR